MTTFEDLQRAGKNNVDTALRSVGALSKGAQAIAAEVADYSKQSFQDSAAALEKLFGAASFDKAVEVQTQYVKAAYENFTDKVVKIGELYADVAKETYQPFAARMSTK